MAVLVEAGQVEAAVTAVEAVAQVAVGTVEAEVPVVEAHTAAELTPKAWAERKRTRKEGANTS